MEVQMMFEVFFYDGSGDYAGCHTEQFDTLQDAKAWAKANRRPGLTLQVVPQERVLEYVGRGDRA